MIIFVLVLSYLATNMCKKRGVAIQMGHFEYGHSSLMVPRSSLPQVLNWQILLQRFNAWICFSG